MSWLKQALTREDNRTYDGAYLALAAVIAMVGISILWLMILASIDMLSDSVKDFSYGALGGGIAAIIGALGAFIGSVGAYILMERKGIAVTDAGPVTTKTTTDSQTTVVKTTATASTPVVADAAAGNASVEPLSPKIGPDDVGKSVAIVKPKTKRRKRA